MPISQSRMPRIGAFPLFIDLGDQRAGLMRVPSLMS
jgi:hypothetical protein